MGLEPTGVGITGAEKRFGSCSAKNRLSFSWRLMRYPEAAVDYVVVHELAHIRHKNHGKEFYALIESYMPDYKERRKLLKE
jgi:predicted metal-dependent hydrolase